MVRTDSRITEGQTHTPHSTALGSVETYSPRVKRGEQKTIQLDYIKISKSSDLVGNGEEVFFNPNIKIEQLNFLY